MSKQMPAKRKGASKGVLAHVVPVDPSVSDEESCESSITPATAELHKRLGQPCGPRMLCPEEIELLRRSKREAGERIRRRRGLPLSDAQLQARDATRDIGAELLQSVRDIKAGRIGAVRVIDKDTVAAAERRAARLRRNGYAIRARVNLRERRLIVELSTGIEMAVSIDQLEGLRDATSADLSRIEITPSGLGLHWPQLDADIDVPGLLRGVFGSRAWMRALAKRIAFRGDSGD